MFSKPIGHLIHVLLVHFAINVVPCPTLSASPEPLKANWQCTNCDSGAYVTDLASHLQQIDFWFGNSLEAYMHN